MWDKFKTNIINFLIKKSDISSQFLNFLFLFSVNLQNKNCYAKTQEQRTKQDKH